MALSVAALKIVWLRVVLNEFGIEQTCTVIHHNSLDAIEWVKGRPAEHISLREHVETRRKFVTDLAETGIADLMKTRTVDMRKRLLTKALKPRGLEVEMRGAELFCQN